MDLKRIGFWFLSFILSIVVFLTTLKLWHNVDIGWLWVFAPIWIPISIITIAIVFILCSVLIKLIIKKVDEKKEEDNLKIYHTNDKLKRHINRRFHE
jgi:hypothetical protein